jgi:hypothetical protein
MEAGLDWLSLLCESGDPRQIEILARDVLPLAEQEPAPTI